MDDGHYLAADERAREARRAGLQAKKDEQPANTARSYAAKQREWKKWCLTPRVAEDGSTSYCWPDGELVTPDKLAAWLKEDILLRRVPPKKPKTVGKLAWHSDDLMCVYCLCSPRCPYCDRLSVCLSTKSGGLDPGGHHVTTRSDALYMMRINIS